MYNFYIANFLSTYRFRCPSQNHTIHTHCFILNQFFFLVIILLVLIILIKLQKCVLTLVVASVVGIRIFQKQISSHSQHSYIFSKINPKLTKNEKSSKFKRIRIRIALFWTPECLSVTIHFKTINTDCHRNIISNSTSLLGKLKTKMIKNKNQLSLLKIQS